MPSADFGAVTAELFAFDRSQLSAVETVDKTLPMIARTPPTNAATTLDATKEEMHGRLGPSAWAAPALAAWANVEARPGYDSKLAHEYVDAADVLREKVRLVATLIRRSRQCVAYTGAGISTASGIGDYASRASNSLAGDQDATKMLSPLEAQPTSSHCVLTALHASGHLKRWVQQNHDGLPQKAGFPQSALNEIHGAWFDPANPVVKMSGELRSDLFEDLLHWEDTADLVLVLGTSLAGMNADRLVATCARRARGATGNALGTVIVSLQQTAMDKEAAVRIFAKIDDVMRLLAEELSLEPATPPDFTVRSRNKFLIPYGSDGKKLPAGTPAKTLDLSVGARVRITGGQFKGDIGEVVSRTRQGHYSIRFMHTVKGNFKAPMTHTLGQWWAEEAETGKLQHFPIEGLSLEQVVAAETEAAVLARQRATVIHDAVGRVGLPKVDTKACSAELPDWVKQSYLKGKNESKPAEEANDDGK